MIQNAQQTIEMSILEARMNEALEHQRGIQRARDYYHGKQLVFLTARMREYLSLPSANPKARALIDTYINGVRGVLPPNSGNGAASSIDFHLNIIQTIVLAVLDELSVLSFDTSETASESGEKDQVSWARKVWEFNKMQMRQHTVHEGALRDHESFIMVDYDDDQKMPRLTYHEYYVDQAAGGNGCGVVLVYENDDPSGRLLCAIKEWLETEQRDGKPYSYKRRNVYYSDRVEKFYRDPEWEHYQPDGAAWPTPWLAKDGSALGIPVISFRNFGGAPEAWEALGPQDAINKVFLDVLAEADGAFRMFFVTGSYGTTDGRPAAEDGSNLVSVSPMSLIGIPGVDTGVTTVDGGDPTNLIDALKNIILIVAQITATPVSYFSISKQIAGVDTLKGQDKPLSKKVEKRKDIFGQSWEDVIRMARRVANAFGNAGLDEAVTIETIWKQVFDLETIQLMRDVLGLPEETLWRMYGLSEEQIQAAKETDEYKAKMVDRNAVFWTTWATLEGGSISFAQYAKANGWDDKMIADFVKEMEQNALTKKTSAKL